MGLEWKLGVSALNDNSNHVKVSIYIDVFLNLLDNFLITHGLTGMIFMIMSEMFLGKTSLSVVFLLLLLNELRG